MSELLPWLISFFFLFIAHKMWDTGVAWKLEGKFHIMSYLYKFFAVFVGLSGFITLYGLVRPLLVGA